MKTQIQAELEAEILANRLHEYATRYHHYDQVKTGLVLLSYLRGECEHIDRTGEYSPGYFCELCGLLANPNAKVSR